MVHKSDAMLIIYDAEKEGSARNILIMKHEKSEMTSNYPIWQISFDDLQQECGRRKQLWTNEYIL